MDKNEEQYMLFNGIIGTLYFWRASEAMGAEGHMDEARKIRDEYLAKVEAFEAMNKAKGKP